MNSNLKYKSKKLSYALRHNPKEFNLTLDENGWAILRSVISNVGITINEIKEIIRESDKQRFELDEPHRIRAYYGHSIENKIKLKEIVPIKFLLHGTSPATWYNNIIDEGLLSMDRQYVHLTSSIETALKIGKRKYHDPIIVLIRANLAYKNGIKFYQGNNDIILSDSIPIDYLGLVE